MASSARPASTPPRRPRFLRQALRLAGPYWNAPHRRKLRTVALLLVLLTLAQVALAVWTNYWNRALFDALERRSVSEVLVQVGVFALIFALTLAVTAAHLLVKRWLQLDWRRWLTEQLVGSWMASGRHYRLLFSTGDHDNPDGRIAEDIRIATETAIALAHTLLYSIVTFALFVDILWRVSGAVHIPGTGLHVPGYLVWLAFLYAGVGAVLGWGFGKPLVRSTNALQTAEANFRFGLARARENSEAIALMQGEPLERAVSHTRFSDIVHDWNRQSLAYVGIVAFSTGYGSLLPVFPIMVAAPQYIAGAMTLGVLMQAAQAFQKLTSALSWPIDNLGDMARARASADRVLSLSEDMRRLDSEVDAHGPHRIEIGRNPRPLLVLDKLVIAEPNGRVLLQELSCEVHRGERVLVSGDPAATSGLFKVIGGLWPWGSGRVLLPDEEPLLFMPQRPFLPAGTLRAVLYYPLPPDHADDATILRALECSGLAWLAPRLDESDDWERVLPQRAQQRIGFARALMRRSAWIFMEESTDAFDPPGEREILEMLHRQLPNSTLLTISFHPDLEQLHTRKVVLNRVKEELYLSGSP